MKILLVVVALAVGAWGQQAKWEFKAGRRLLWDGTILDLTKTPITTDMQSGGGWYRYRTVQGGNQYDLPAVKKTRKVSTCMVMDNMDKSCLLWSKPTATETYYTCISPTLPPGLALVVSEDLTRGWCTGPHYDPKSYLHQNNP